MPTSDKDGMTSVPVLAALYVPAIRPDRFDKAASAGADVVIIDLEDSVPPDRKDAARLAAADYLSTRPPAPTVVRVNGTGTPWHTDDLSALQGVTGNLSGVRLPKAEQVDQVRRLTDTLGPIPVHLIVESALGVERIFDLAHTAGVASVGLGEADLRSHLGITSRDGLDWVRSRLIVAAAAAGLPPPLMSVWTAIKDLDGLADSCRDGKAQGFVGRNAIHPSQIPVIRDAFTPTDGEVARARAVLDALATAAGQGSGVAVLPDGSMVDKAMRAAAERIVALADRTRRRQRADGSSGTDRVGHPAGTPDTVR